MKRSIALVLTALFGFRCGEIKSPTSPTQLCQQPAPLLGEQSRAFPGADPDEYLIMFKPGYSGQPEAARLAAKYGFTVTSVFTLVPGFSARLASSTVNGLRCESSVQTIEFAHTNIPPP